MPVTQERLGEDDLSALRRDLGQKIAAGRRAKKELQRDLAIKLSTSQQNVSKLERGVSVLIPSHWIPKLVEYLDAAQAPSCDTLAATSGNVESEASERSRIYLNRRREEIPCDILTIDRARAEAEQLLPRLAQPLEWPERYAGLRERIPALVGCLINSDGYDVLQRFMLSLPELGADVVFLGPTYDTELVRCYISALEYLVRKATERDDPLSQDAARIELATLYVQQNLSNDVLGVLAPCSSRLKNLSVPLQYQYWNNLGHALMLIGRTQEAADAGASADVAIENFETTGTDLRKTLRLYVTGLMKTAAAIRADVSKATSDELDQAAQAFDDIMHDDPTGVAPTSAWAARRRAIVLVCRGGEGDLDNADDLLRRCRQNNLYKLSYRFRGTVKIALGLLHWRAGLPARALARAGVDELRRGGIVEDGKWIDAMLDRPSDTLFQSFLRRNASCALM